MPDIQIRCLEGDELIEAMYGLNAYALHASPPLTNREEWEGIVRPRQGVTYMASFENGVPASGAASTAMVQNVRGKLFETDVVMDMPVLVEHGLAQLVETASPDWPGSSANQTPSS